MNAATTVAIAMVAAILMSLGRGPSTSDGDRFGMGRD
jgi:hypothetical protein